MSERYIKRDSRRDSRNNSLPIRRKASRERQRKPESSRSKTGDVPEVHITVPKEDEEERDEDDEKPFISIGIDLGTT